MASDLRLPTSDFPLTGILPTKVMYPENFMSSVRQVETIISAPWMIPIEPAERVFKDCSVVIDRGRIVAVVPTEGLHQRYTSANHIQLPKHVIMPGFVNAHGHGAMSLLRGFADDKPLHTWLNEHIWPAEGRWVSEQFVRDGTELAVAEMLKTGTTCYSDMYFYPEAAAKVSQTSGLRAQITFPILDFPTAWASEADEYIHKGLALHDDYRSFERISIGFGPHAPYTVSDEPLRRVATLANELQAPIHIHLHETADEVTQAVKEQGKRPIQRLYELGVLTPYSQCVHMTQVNDDDLDLLQKTGASVIHCPESNLKLASGLCPVQWLLDNGVVVGLGTDGAASNNDLDMLGELATAALVGKHAAADATAISAHTALTMATLGSARALGLDADIGSIAAGKAADIIALELDDISFYPSYDLASQLVYNNRKARVTHSWVAGKSLLRDGLLTTLNEKDIRAKALDWQQRMSAAHTD